MALRKFYLRTQILGTIVHYLVNNIRLQRTLFSHILGAVVHYLVTNIRQHHTLFSHKY